ncbi:MAG: sigma-70 family RNA polymerase sigma factor [Acidobacteriaceae bacterium]|nr:sigma-70 family RNA polymerase sigma factor [Acidobacteriaceae bacterium]
MLTDESLALHLQTGDPQAFELLFARHSASVRRVAASILRDAGEADDVVQIVFFDVHRAIKLYDATRGTLRTWLLQYAYHRALNHKQSLQRKGFYSGSPLEAAEAPSTLRRSLLPAEAAQAVRQAISHLTEDQRRTLEMLFLEGAEMSDVALQLGQNLSNVRHHYYRGLRKLRDVLQG